MKNEKNKLYWRLCVLLAAMVTVVGFSPLVLAYGKIHPELMGVPYTLWASFFATLSLVILTYIGSGYLLGSQKEGE